MQSDEPVHEFIVSGSFVTDQPDLCEFQVSRGGVRSCPEYAVATVTMPENAPKRFRRCCEEHARGFEEIGEEVVRDAGR